MKKAPPKKLFEDRKTYDEYKRDLDTFLDSQEHTEVDHKLLKLESLYEQKFQVQEERYHELEQKYTDLRLEKEEIKLRMKQDLEVKEAEATERLQTLEAKYTKERDDLKSYIDYIKSHYEVSTKQIEDENSFEMAALHAKITELSASQVSQAQLMNRTKQIISLKRDLDIVNAELVNQKKEFLAQLAEKDVKMKRKLEETTAQLIEQNRSLSEKLNEKTMEVVHLQKDVERITGERNVLNYQITETKEKAGPLENQIAMLQEQAQAYETERLKALETITNLKHRISLQANKMKYLANEVSAQKRIVSERDHTVRQVSQAIFDVVFSEDANDPTFLKQGILNLYDRFVKDTPEEDRLKDPDACFLDKDVPRSLIGKKLPTLEFARQQDTLQRLASCMQRNAQRAHKKLQQQKKHSLTENAKLLSENKSLRRRVLVSEQRLEAMEKEVRQKPISANNTCNSFKIPPRPNTAGNMKKSHHQPSRLHSNNSEIISTPSNNNKSPISRRRPNSAAPSNLVDSAIEKDREYQTDWIIRAALRPSSKGSC